MEVSLERAAGPARATRLIFSSVIRITGICAGMDPSGAIMVGLGRPGVERLMLALDGRALWAAGSHASVPRGLRSRRAVDHRVRRDVSGVLRGFVSAYSQNDFAGML